MMVNGWIKNNLLKIFYCQEKVLYLHYNQTTKEIWQN